MGVFIIVHILLGVPSGPKLFRRPQAKIVLFGELLGFDESTKLAGSLGVWSPVDSGIAFSNKDDAQVVGGHGRPTLLLATTGFGGHHLDLRRERDPTNEIAQAVGALCLKLNFPLHDKAVGVITGVISEGLSGFFRLVGYSSEKREKKGLEYWKCTIIFSIPNKDKTVCILGVCFTD